MTRMRLVPVGRARTPAEERTNRSALLGVAVEVRREFGWKGTHAMANPQADTVKIIESCGGKVVWPPMKLGKRHAKGSEEWGAGQKLLVAIIHVPNGQYFKEVSSDMALRDVKASPYSATFMEVSKKTLDALKAHPRSNEIFD